MARHRDDATAQGIIEAALESGIRFFDNAYKYNGGYSEEVLGKFLTPKYREYSYIMTKADTRDPEIPARQQLEESLRRMKTDYVDLWMVHTIVDAEDAEKRVAEMWEVCQEARAEGKVRHFGFTGHKDSSAHIKAIETLKDNPAEACLMPMSPSDFISRDSFIHTVLPPLLNQDYGVLAMKTMNAGNVVRAHEGKQMVPDRMSLEEHQWFTLSLPITSWVSGMESIEQVKQNTEIARRFTQLSEDDRMDLANRVTDMANISALQPYRRWDT